MDGILNNLFVMFSEMFFSKARGGCFDDKRRVVSGAPNDNFRKNICSEGYFRSRIFETFVLRFLASASPRIFEHLKNGIIAYF